MICGGNYRSKSVPLSRAEKQALSMAAMESIGICVPSIMSRRFSLQRNFRTIPLVVLVCAASLSAILLKIRDCYLRLLGKELQKQPEFFIELRLDGLVQIRLLVS